MYFKTPYDFATMLCLYLFCVLQAAIQCNFLIRFSSLKNKIWYYLIYFGISCLDLAVGFFTSIPQNISTIIGIVVLIIFSISVLKQNYITAAISSILAVTANVLVESILPPLRMLLQDMSVLPAVILNIVEAVLMLVLNYLILRFFVKKYNIKVNEKYSYMILLVLPLLFICIVMRTLIAFQYPAVYVDNKMVSYATTAENIQFLIIGITAFLCVSGSLFAYEKVVNHVESENEKKLLKAQLNIQEIYVEEAKIRYESTRTFRHDFKNHLIALKGLVEKREISKIERYLERFEEISKEMSFDISTGNTVIDILLSEKLTHAKNIGIDVKLDVEVPPTVQIDDFDLCAIFSNAVDNAVKACDGVTKRSKLLDITAKQHNKFFVIDIFNTFDSGNIVKGEGIGIATIHMIAEKYHGAVEITEKDGTFRLSIILPFEKS